MKEQLYESIRRFVPLTAQEFETLYSKLSIRSLKKREHLLKEGQICKAAYFIVEGLVRYYHIIDGEEHTGQFFFENGWYSDYESFLLEKPSDQYIQTLERSTVAVLSRQAAYELYDILPKFERFGRLMAENAFIGLRRRTETLTHLSAEERYLNLVNNRPKVIQRVPQHYIASYLGIKPQSLSRIRKRIFEES